MSVYLFLGVNSVLRFFYDLVYGFFIINLKSRYYFSFCFADEENDFRGDLIICLKLLN